MSTEVISVRIKRELKEEVIKLGINVREVVERALEKMRRGNKLSFDEFKLLMELGLFEKKVS